MPKITQGNAKEHLFSAVRKFAEVTGEQVGLIMTCKGNLTIIGQDSFKEYVNQHRREIQRAFLADSYAKLNPPLPTPSQSIDKENESSLLNSNIDPSTFSI